MSHSGLFDWSTSSAAQQVDHIRSLPREALRGALSVYDWSQHPESVLGWAMAQRDIDLGTALTVFFNGGPARFNYMPKSHVPTDYRGVARVLDNICLRVNSGFYLVYPGQGERCQATLSKWLTYQEADRDEGRRGRWILDERILDPMLGDSLRLHKDTAADKRTHVSLWRDLFSPILGLGVDRNLLKYKGPRR
jgi:hypothetical protein